MAKTTPIPAFDFATQRRQPLQEGVDMDKKNEGMTQDERDFASAWGDEAGSTSQSTVKPSGDATAAGAAGGASAEASAASPEADAGPKDGAPEAAAGVPAGKEAGDATGGEQAAAPAAGDGAAVADSGSSEAAAAGDDGDAIDPKDAQREASWRGRLEKRERDLEAREAKLKEAEAKLQKDPEAGAEAIEAVAKDAAESGDSELAAAASDAAEQVESGATSVSKAMARLKEDFGDEFTDMLSEVIRDIVRQEADQITDGKLKQSLGDLESRVMDGFKSIGERHLMLHREKIEEAVPELETLIQKPEFEAFRDQYENGNEIVNSGTARQIIKMMKAFEQSMAGKDEADGTRDAGKDQIDRDAAVAQDQPSEAALAAAEGVRSSGAARVPDAPAESTDYAGAWNAA